MEWFVGYVVVVAVLWFALRRWRTDPELLKQRSPFNGGTRMCQKQPDKECPYKVTFRAGSNGMSMHASGHAGCCKIMDQLKAMNAAGCRMEPGVDYNGNSISKGYKAQVMRSKEYFEQLDTSGPLTKEQE